MDRTLITHTKALDLTRPVTFVSNAKYDADLGVSLEWGGVVSTLHASAWSLGLCLLPAKQQWPVQPFHEWASGLKGLTSC